MGNKSGKTNSPALAEAKTLVEQAISTYPVVIFSKTYCPYCSSAKSNIKKAGASIANFTPPKVYELDFMGARGRAIQAYLAEKTGRRTVPNVFIGGVTVGGGDEIASYAHRNILKQMLTQAPQRLAASKLPADSQPDPDSPEAIVEQAVKHHPVVVFSKSWCPYCTSAKRNLHSVAETIPGYDGPKVFELDEMGDMGRQIQDYLSSKTGRHTVPNVFIAGKTVGGGDEVSALAYRGELTGMVTSAVEKASPPPAVAHDSTKEETPTAKAGPSTNPAKDLVEQSISSNPVVLFSKTWCPYCFSAKANLSTVGADVPGYAGAKLFELDEMGELGEEVQRYLGEKTGQHTVPNVFISGTSVGGGNEIAGYARRGELRQMLIDAVSASSVNGQSEKPGPVLKEIVFGAGCFWGVELAFQRVVGVEKTEVGYSNGRFAQVTYDAVCTGRTGSAEVVRVTYDPVVVTVKELLAVWERRHDPTSLNKQGNDLGTQYRSAIYYNDEEQKEEIDKWLQEASGRVSKPIVTEISRVSNYCPAEEYHQRYLEKKGQSAEKGATEYIRCYG